jgi:hypothetical protein
MRKAREHSQLTWIHQAAVAERVALIACWARAHGDVIVDFAVGVGAALADAWIDAVAVLAGLINATLYVVGAFTSSAVREWISAVAGWATANWSTTEGLLANCASSAWLTRASLSCAWVGKEKVNVN